MTPAVRVDVTGHVYAGRCPDHTQPRQRDRYCPACQFLIRVERDPAVKAAMKEARKAARKAAKEHKT